MVPPQNIWIKTYCYILTYQNTGNYNKTATIVYFTKLFGIILLFIISKNSKLLQNNNHCIVNKTILNTGIYPSGNRENYKEWNWKFP
jgi:hypothetical protein